MATASSHPRPRVVSHWRRPLLVGLCFGLGYGLTQRLLELRLPGFVQWGQSFDVREAPGTSLESLRLRFGSEGQELRGRLDLLDLPPAKPEALKQPEQAGATADQPLEEPGLPPAKAPAAEAPAPAAAPPAPSLPPPSTPRLP